jgi:hypothetical protein
MKLEDILQLWEEDSVIDKQNISDEALKISKLHHKYYRIFINERLTLRKYESELKVLKKDKYEFYTQGPTEETHNLGWRLPPIGKILRTDAGMYVDTDKDIINLALKIGIQHEKVDLLESVIKSLRDRNFNLRAAIDWEKFKAGI